MYKKIVLCSLLFFQLIHCVSNMSPWFEIKPSYFFFHAFPMKKIYNHGGFEIQGSASVPVWNCFDLYGSIGYRKVRGHALGSCEKTGLTVIPIDIGIKPIFNFCERYCYFFAVGPRYFHFHQHNNSPYVDCKINGNGIGLFVNTGFNMLLTDCLMLGVFGEYSYENKKVCPCMQNVFSNGGVQIGGFAFGLSLGYAF